MFMPVYEMLCYVVFAWSTSDETIEEIGMDNASKTDFETRSNKTIDDDESCLEIKNGIAIIYHKDFKTTANLAPSKINGQFYCQNH